MMTPTAQDEAIPGYATSSRSPWTETILVTPNLARGWLSMNTHNRNIRQRYVNAWAHDMLAGRWKFTGESIKISKTGVLLDGQHRLLAVIQADTPVLMSVTFGLDDDTQVVMDSGLKRTTGDAMALTGIENSRVVAALTRSIYLAKKHREPTKPEQMAFYEENRALIERAVGFAQQAKAEGLPATSAIALAWLMLIDADEPAATDFITTLITGLNLTEGSPIRLLRRRLVDGQHRRQNGNAASVKEMLRPFYVAWNAWCDGRELRFLRVTVPADGTLPTLNTPHRLENINA